MLILHIRIVWYWCYLPCSLYQTCLVRDSGIPHCFIGLYAPWDPGIDNISLTEFWQSVCDLIQQARSWTIIGDFNTTVSAAESSNPTAYTSTNSHAFQAFQSTIDGLDTWSLSPECHYLMDYTCHAGSGHSLINWVLFSHSGVLHGEIALAPYYVGATDHRPIEACIFLGSSPELSCSPMPSQNSALHYYYPWQTEHNHLRLFIEQVDALLRDSPQAHEPVVDDPSYELRYNVLTHIMLTAADTCFTLCNNVIPITPLFKMKLSDFLYVRDTALVASSLPLKLGQFGYRSYVIHNPGPTNTIWPIRLTSKFLKIQLSMTSSGTSDTQLLSFNIKP